MGMGLGLAREGDQDEHGNRIGMGMGIGSAQEQDGHGKTIGHRIGMGTGTGWARERDWAREPDPRLHTGQQCRNSPGIFQCFPTLTFSAKASSRVVKAVSVFVVSACKDFTRSFKLLICFSLSLNCS